MPIYGSVAKTRNAARPKELLHWKQFVARKYLSLCFDLFPDDLFSDNVVVLRHDGAHREVDLNERLREPMIDSIMHRWAPTFEVDPLAGLRLHVQNQLLDFFDDLLHSLPEDSQSRVYDPIQDTLRVSKGSVQKAFANAAAYMDRAGRSASRQIQTDIKEELEPGYEMARHEFGPGHLQRIKVYYSRTD